MKKLTFDKITKEPLSDWYRQSLARKTGGNGLFELMISAYSQHTAMVISPDDVLNNIACVWAKYININAEEFRDFFVSHDGKKELEYKSSGSFGEHRMGEFAAGLLNLVKADQDNDNLAWLDVTMSTTRMTDKLVRAYASLSSQQEYYDYKTTLLCGFPEIILLGDTTDWNKVANAVNNMPAPNLILQAWRRRLLSIIPRMWEGEEDFWQTAITKKKYGSGGQYAISGWATMFNPFNPNGDWMDSVDDRDRMYVSNPYSDITFITEIDDKDILDLTCSFPIKVNDNGDLFTVDVVSGPTKIEYNENDYMRVQNVLSTERR